MRGWLAVALPVLLTSAAGAQDRIVLSEVLGSWQGDDTVQFVELQLVADGQQDTANAAELVFDDAGASSDARRFFTLTTNLARGTSGATVLFGTARLAQVSGLTPDFVLPDGWLPPRAGRVCWQVADGQGGVRVVDCLAYGAFTGPTFGFGPPTAVTPDDRSLARVDTTGVIRRDWQGVLEPTPQTNAGTTATLRTLCGNGAISQGEECDGDALGGATCASLGFAKGTLRCVQCHRDTSRCSFCGNGAINEPEACDGADLGERTCETLGFTGGTLACSARCTLDTAGCDDTFFLPGGGPPKADCQLEWQVRHAGAKPDGSGKAPPRLKCRDGDPACDGDTTAGTCTLPVRLCFGREDGRLPTCTPRPTASLSLASTSAGASMAAALVAAAGALDGASASGGTVTFAQPGLEAGRCTGDVSLVLPVRGKVKLRARAVASGGKPKDPDVVRFACVP